MTNLLMSTLMLLKLGVYTPSMEAPFKGWFYVSAEVFKTERVKYNSNNEWGWEIGGTMEPYFVHQNYLGWDRRLLLFSPVAMMGVTRNYGNDIDFALGIKYRAHNDLVQPYLGASFRFSTLKRK